MSFKDELFDASKTGDLEKIKEIVDSGMHIDISDNTGKTPLVILIMRGHDNIAKYLMEIGANPKMRDAYGNDALYYAIPDKLTLYMLDNYDFDLSRKNKEGLTYLAKATQKYIHTGNERLFDIIDVLLKKGSPITTELHEYITIFSDNRPYGDIKERSDKILEIFDTFLNYFEASGGITRLMNAAAEGNLKLIKTISPVEYNQIDESGNTPLIYAVLGGNLNVIEYLLKNGADVNQANEEGISPLSWALINEERTVAKLLISFGADYEELYDEYEDFLKSILEGEHVDIENCADITDLITLRKLNPYGTISILFPGSKKQQCYDKYALRDYLDSQTEIYGLDNNEDYVYVKVLPPRYYIDAQSSKLLKNSKKHKFLAKKIYNKVGFGSRESREYSPVYILEEI